MVQKIIVRSGIYRIYGIFGIRSRDREIAPTEEGSAVSGQEESRSGDRSYRRGVRGQRSGVAIGRSLLQKRGQGSAVGMGRMEVVELSECTLHLVEYAANRGLARIPRMPRIKGSVLRYLPFFVLMGVGGWRLDRSQDRTK